eukprot:2153732-Prymnesium_polylepis.1
MAGPGCKSLTFRHGLHGERAAPEPAAADAADKRRQQQRELECQLRRGHPQTEHVAPPADAQAVARPVGEQRAHHEKG